MTSVVIAIISVFTLGNLALTLAVIRRLAQLRAEREERPADLPAVGTVVGTFSAADQHGHEFSDRDIRAGGSRVVFLLPGCGPCAEVRAALHDLPVDQGPLFVGIAGNQADPECAEILAELPDHVRAVTGPPASQMAKAFGVSGFPAVLWVVDGSVTLAANRLHSGDRRPVAQVQA